MELATKITLKRMLQVAKADAARADGLRQGGDEFQENIVSSVDKLCTIVEALLEDAARDHGLHYHGQDARLRLELLPAGELDARD